MIVLLLILINLSGCFLTDPFVRPVVSRMELKKKYGEDFKIINYWNDRGGFDAMCSPVNDENIVFLSKFYSDGELIGDRYVNGIVSKQIQERLMPILQDISKKIYIQPVLLYKDLQYENMSTVTIENYSEYMGNKRGSLKLFLIKDELMGLDPEEEYNLYKKIVTDEVPCIDAISIYMIEEDELDDVIQFYQNNESIEDEIDAIVSQDKMIHFYYGDDGINTTYEEYYKQRQEIY